MRRTTASRPLKRYAALLLFQFRVVAGERANRRRLVERRIVLLSASNAHQALAHALHTGRGEEHVYENARGGRVHFEFVGVLELLCLAAGCEDNEVWYELAEMMEPMERRQAIIPPVARLSAIRNGE